jgi:FSR family fosmidomycin resistance protein-like MFS transporter
LAWRPLFALLLALGSYPAWVVPVLFGVMGFSSGIAGPSRDLLVKRSTPDNASGRVYGVVYAGLDIGQAVSPLIFGAMMDHGQYRGVLLGLALMQGVLIASAFNVRRVRRTALPALRARCRPPSRNPEAGRACVRGNNGFLLELRTPMA